MIRKLFPITVQCVEALTFFGKVLTQKGKASTKVQHCWSNTAVACTDPLDETEIHQNMNTSTSTSTKNVTFIAPLETIHISLKQKHLMRRNLHTPEATGSDKPLQAHSASLPSSCPSVFCSQPGGNFACVCSLLTPSWEGIITVAMCLICLASMELEAGS